MTAGATTSEPGSKPNDQSGNRVHRQISTVRNSEHRCRFVDSETRRQHRQSIQREKQIANPFRFEEGRNRRPNTPEMPGTFSCSYHGEQSAGPDQHPPDQTIHIRRIHAALILNFFLFGNLGLSPNSASPSHVNPSRFHMHFTKKQPIV